MRAQLTVLIVFLLSINTVQHLTLSDDVLTKTFTSSRATGVDLSVSDISYGYPNFADQQKYQMFLLTIQSLVSIVRNYCL